MKIVNIRSVIVHAEMRNWIFVRVETDQDGLFGWGEATLEWKTRSVAGAIDDLAPLLIGRDPRDIEKLVRIMKKHSFWRLGVIGMSAVSGIEIALWDILGKSLSVPVWMLLGGRVRDRVRVIRTSVLATCARSMKPNWRSNWSSARIRFLRAAIAR